ncbi:MltR family transcriptional regulator [Stenotrophomonas maltophilia]|uniref:MltR family transcriptional regulator n=1 Tax=Stenotrophomonas maltophilia TaxID=40324 RepID=UPI00244AADC1|nr:MltR family transcriptional regulator [Stenotrophomonas maltophilia]MDG9768007.1 MltR family transcriptional regulator [Stenotrophomonas maltophilia]MDH0539241.1 MltR family transcriptional regulator [Stenotrophomonas maltophilia]MDH0793218.1 MltR family transcriptional regulator [Stenotrophomonas maltophilia]MDH2033077.1 MltR family transcriptional regulator [Stenotrophomonas maltophilia]
MREKDLADLQNFLTELQAETDRGLALVGLALLDEKLLETLQAFFVDGKSSTRLLTDPNAPLGTLSARIEACAALGLITPDEHQEIGLLRRIRNEFAHKRHGLDFNSPKVAGLCTSLKSNLPMDDARLASNRFRFINATVLLTLSLFYRAEWVAKEKRVPKIWGDPEMSDWRTKD